MKKTLHGFTSVQFCYRLFFLSFTLLSFVQLQAADYTVQQWQMVEINFTSSTSYSDPFNTVTLKATFTHTDGTIVIRPCFWDGGTTWRVRFAPTKTGTWTMVTTCQDVTNNGLHNISKTILCNSYTGTLDIYKHGFLKTAAGGRYFVYNDGTPFFYLGDTHWLFTHERFSTSNVSGVPSQFKYTVDKRVTQGFSVYQSEAIQHPHGGTHTGSDEEIFCNFRDGFDASDLAGFANMDRKFQYIADKGLVHANSQICWALDPVDYASVYTDSFMYKLGRYWVARYGAYPVMWTIAQEIDQNMYGNFNSTTMSKWYAVGQAISDNDPYHQPLSAHMENSGSTLATSSSWGSKSYHSWWAVQWQGDQTDVGTAKNFWNSSPAKPSVLYESPYEAFWTDAKGARGAGYKAFQDGMYGYGYGSNGTWNDLYTSSDVGTAYEMPDRYLNWYDGANLAGGGQMLYLKQFYTGLEWWKLQPRFDDASWATFSDGSHSMLSSDGQVQYVVYFCGSGTGTGTLKNMLNGYTYTAKWFNPTTGAYTTIGSFVVSGNQYTIPARPTSDDWLLTVKTDSSAPTNPAGNGPNLALHKTYSSSTNWDGTQTAGKAFDSSYATNWQAQSGTFANQWLAVDFGKNTSFDKVILSEYDNRATGYRIEYSNNGSSWTTAYTGTAIGNSKTITFATVTARYLRLYYTSGTSYAPIIYEFEVYNTSLNLALNRTYTSSTNWDGNQTADKAFDASTATNWQAQDGTFANQWLSVNFGSPTTFDKIYLSEYGNRTGGYRIEYSTNGSSWTTAYTGTTIGAARTITFSAVTAQYARIYFTSGTGNAPIIYEMEVYKTSSNMALNSSAYTSSTYWDANQMAPKAFDGSQGTNWQAQSGTFANQWLAVNFGSARTFDKVVLSEYGDRTTGFRIEYSSDGTNWSTAYTGTTIGSSKTITFTAVTGSNARIYFTSGTSFAPIIYEFEIYNSTATNADKSAKMIAQSTAEISEQVLKPGLNALFPNPVNQRLSFVYNALTAGKIDVQVYDISGRQVLRQNMQVAQGSNTGVVDVSNARGGVYFIRIAGDQTYVQKFIINR